MAEELVDELDRDGNFIATRPRSYLKQRVFFYKASLVIPITGNGEILLSKRAENKHPYPVRGAAPLGEGSFPERAVRPLNPRDERGDRQALSDPETDHIRIRPTYGQKDIQSIYNGCAGAARRSYSRPARGPMRQGVFYRRGGEDGSRQSWRSCPDLHSRVQGVCDPLSKIGFATSL